MQGCELQESRPSLLVLESVSLWCAVRIILLHLRDNKNKTVTDIILCHHVCGLLQVAKI